MTIIFLSLILLTLLLFLALVFRRKSPKLTKLREEWRKGFKNGWAFEKFSAELFNSLGYKAIVTKGSHDFGADLIIKDRRNTFVLQAKYYTNSISPKAIEEALIAAAIYGVDKIGIITNGEIPQAVRDFAEEIRAKTFVTKVALIGKGEIERMLRGERVL
ncbi:restriction endonuclease [Pseudothermotoga sp. U03pept]|uniref:restriction endonuclease n=1 Tax=Pseudothermotoga sp. U03pept TaxID=3447012 RepID=UPI003F025B60